MINKRKLRILLLILAGIGVVLLMIFMGFVFYSWPRPVWIIEDQYVQAWEKVLAASPSPLPKAKIISASDAEARVSDSWYGYRIDSNYEARTAVENQGPVHVYRRFRSGDYGDAVPLAVDPWLVFHKFTSPRLTREEAENGSGGSDLILLAGGDRAAVLAWTAQLVQEAPGVFSRNEELWEQTETRLLRGNFFQRGAMTYSWNEMWPPLLGEGKDVRVYAPLSRIRQMPTHQTNVLEADVFPGRQGWNSFGLQTDIMWAVPYGSWKNRERLKPVEEWLRSAELQTLLADTLGWLSAHPESPPFNPVTSSARIYYLTASYIWQTHDWQGK
jgi:hypothetical protein